MSVWSRAASGGARGRCCSRATGCELTWKARLSRASGQLRVEPMQAFGNRLLDDPAPARGPGQRQRPARRGAGRARAASAPLCRRCWSCWRRCWPKRAGLRPMSGSSFCCCRSWASPSTLERCAVTGGTTTWPMSRRAPGVRSAAPPPGIWRHGCCHCRRSSSLMFLLRSPKCAAGLRLAGHFLAKHCSPPPTAPCPPPASA